MQTQAASSVEFEKGKISLVGLALNVELASLGSGRLSAEARVNYGNWKSAETGEKRRAAQVRFDMIGSF